MELTPDLLGAAAVGLIVIVGAIGNYLRLRKSTAPVDPALRLIGAELGSREQMDRLIAELKRIADALTDKNTAGINDRLEDLAGRIDAMTKRR